MGGWGGGAGAASSAMTQYHGERVRITIITLGSRGDAEPYVALGVGLAHAGYDVTVATHEMFRALAEERDLAFAPLGGDPRGVLADPLSDRWLATGRRRHLLPAARAFLRTMPALLAQSLADYWHVAQGSDLLLYSAVAAPVRWIAERLRIPGIAALVQPLHPTRAFPTIALPMARRLGPWGNLATHRLAAHAAWRPVRSAVNAWRQTTLGLAPVPARAPMPWLGAAGTPTLYGFSPRVVPRPDDWDAAIHVTGYWTLAPAASWHPPRALSAFLAAGRPPVSIGFGSMTPRDADRLTAIALDALERAGQRGILLGGWGCLGTTRALPPNVFAIEEVPHGWLFPQMAAIVHHGGAGTTAAALRSGVPSIVVPLGFDQAYWGARVAALGVGPPPRRRGRVSAPWLAGVIRRAIQDPGMRSRAATLGATLRAERGVDAAVAIITQIATLHAESGRATRA